MARLRELATGIRDRYRKSRTLTAGLDSTPGERYALDRLAELANGASPWWARSDGMGLRMRLREAIELADSLADGGLRPETVQWVFEDLVAAFDPASSYIGKHRKALAARFGKTVKSKPQACQPNSQGYATMRAVLQQLEQADFRDELLVNLGDAARHASWKENRLAGLDDLVVLYDAELQTEGYSHPWRARLAASARLRVDGGASLVTALDEAERETRRGESAEDFEVLVPVTVAEEPLGGSTGFPALSRESVESDVASWSAPSLGALMQESEIVSANRFFRYSEKAPDRWAAAAKAADQFRAQVDQWTLRRGAMNEPARALVYEPGGDVTLEGLPPEPLDLAPSELAAHPVEDPDLAAALAQVAQARGAATPGAALVDLWTAVEALLGGRGSDATIEAGLAMARMCPLPYVDAVSRWVGERLGSAGYGVPPAGTELSWVHADVLADRDVAFVKLRESLDPLGWLRLQTLADWEPGPGFANDIDRLRARFSRVAKRAYIVRNTRIHEARRSYPGQGGTLRMFADLVRLTLGHAIRQAPQGPALEQVAYAGLEVDYTAERWQGGDWSRADGIERLT